MGGHCIPIDPFYLTWKAREFGKNTRFIELAGEINTNMPDYVVSKVADALNDQGKALRNSKILVLGLAYKANVDDVRESPSFVLMEKLEAKGAVVEYHDSYVPLIPPTREHAHFTGKQSVQIENAYDLILLSTDHAEYKEFDFSNYSCPLVDTRIVLKRDLKILSGLSKKYLVTGAAGFIASKVCLQLLDQGDQVVGVDNLNDYYDVRLKEWRLQQLKNHSNAKNFNFAKLDIENQESLKALFKNQGPFDAVLNLAARAGVRCSIENPHVYLSTNAEGTLNLLECMRENICKKFVLASTSSLYAGQKIPFTEDLAVNEPLSYVLQKRLENSWLTAIINCIILMFRWSIFHRIWSRRKTRYVSLQIH